MIASVYFWMQLTWVISLKNAVVWKEITFYYFIHQGCLIIM